MDDARSALEVTAPTDKLQQRGLMPFVKINPGKLSSRQKEIYNFQKAAAVLADYGFTCIKLQDDWNGADFLADRFRKKDDTGPGITLRVQLKGRLTIGTKYENKNIHMMFPLAGRWVLIQHEELVRIVEENADWAWKVGPVYHSGKPSAQLVAALRLYMLDAEVPATVAE